MIIISTFTGTAILTGDKNIKIKEDSNIQKQYTELLNNFSSATLDQHSQLQTTKGTKTVDHITTIIPNAVSYLDALPFPSITDYGAPYIVTKTSRPKCQT